MNEKHALFIITHLLKVGYEVFREDGEPVGIITEQEEDLALTSLEQLVQKQTPKEPYFEGDGYYNGELVFDTWICPNCEEHYEVDFERYDYCPKCGQRILWEGYDNVN